MFCKALPPATSIVIRILSLRLRHRSLFQEKPGMGSYPLSSAQIQHGQCQGGSASSVLLQEPGERACKGMTEAAARDKFHLLSPQGENNFARHSSAPGSCSAQKLKGGNGFSCEVCSSSPLKLKVKNCWFKYENLWG